jgi:hypothetical protein
MKSLIRIVLLMLTLSMTTWLLTACSSSGGSGYSRSSVHYGYRGYRGHPWGYDRVYVPVGGGIDPGWGVGGPSGPVATPLPDMGMPDMGGMDFDW